MNSHEMNRIWYICRRIKIHHLKKEVGYEIIDRFMYVDPARRI